MLWVYGYYKYSRLSPTGQITNAVRSSLRAISFGPNSFSDRDISEVITSLLSVTVTHWAFSWHLQILNTRGLCRMFHHRLPTSSQRLINCMNSEVDLDWSNVFRYTCARKREFLQQRSSYKSEGIQECYTYNFIFIHNYFNGVFKSMN